MFKFYTTYSEEGQHLIYNTEKDYGFFFNKWGVYGYIEQQTYLLDAEVTFEIFIGRFNKNIKAKDKSDARRELIKVII